MKKFIAILGLSVSLISCQEKLPSNISVSLFMCELETEQQNPSDSLILSLDQKSIDKLSTDSISRIINKSNFYSDRLERAKKELEELLKYNPEYSDYEEIKNRKSSYRYQNIELFITNLRYLENLELYRKDPGYFAKPVYGNQSLQPMLF